MSAAVRSGALAAGLLTLAVAVLYGRALGFPFVYDDNTLVAGNAALADWGTLGEALTHDLFHFASTRTSPYWRPTVTFSYYLDHAIGGGQVWAFHLSNLLALIAAGLGLWRLCGILGLGGAASLGAALLFVAHPIQVEGAANVAGRTDVLACAFGLWALAARRPAAAAALALLACGAKEIGVVVALAAWLMKRPTWRACALAAALFLVARHGVLSGLELLPGDRPAPTGDSLLGAGSLIGWYLGRLVVPTWLAPAMSISAFGAVLSALGWVGLFAVGAGVWILRERSPAVSGGLALAILPLAAVSGVASASLRYGETFLVMPLAGGVLCLAVAAERWLAPSRAGIALGAAAALAGGVGVGRVGDWSSELALWEGAHRRLPQDPRIRQNLARAAVDQDPERALSLLEGVSVGDQRVEREIWEIRARAHQLSGRGEAMALAVARSVADDPEAGWSNAVYCDTTYLSGSPRSWEVCDWALRAAPGDPALWNIAGISRAVGGAPAQAIPYFERAVALDPEDASYRQNLQNALQDAGLSPGP